MNFDNKELIEDIIKTIKEETKKIGVDNTLRFFILGHCYYFGQIIKALIPEARLYNNENHVIIKIREYFYDITGNLGTGKPTLFESRLIGIAFEKQKNEAPILTEQYFISGGHLVNGGMFFESDDKDLKKFQISYIPFESNLQKEKEVVDQCNKIIEIVKRKYDLTSDSIVKKYQRLLLKKLVWKRI